VRLIRRAGRIRGAGPFRGRTVAARAIAVLYTNRMQVVTTAAAGIRSIADLRGKRVSTGAQGNAVIAALVASGYGVRRE